MTVNPADLWDFSDPTGSERRFSEALSSASEEGALILKTQIARSHGMRQDFSKAKEILAEMATQVGTAGPEVMAYYQLELGRAYASVAHPPDLMTEANIESACRAFMTGFDMAKQAERDDLAVDALHMVAAVSSSVEDKIKWNRKALAFMEASNQAGAKRWEGSLRNNLGYSLHSAGQLEQALEQFNLALAHREREGDPEEIRVARWMIAWTLRAMERVNEALTIQLQLEHEHQQAGAPDPYVFEELEKLYEKLNQPAKAKEYAAKRQAVVVEP